MKKKMCTVRTLNFDIKANLVNLVTCSKLQSLESKNKMIS